MMMTSAYEYEQCRKYVQKCHLSTFLFKKSKHGILRGKLLSQIFDNNIKNVIMSFVKNSKWLVMAMKISTSFICRKGVLILVKMVIRQRPGSLLVLGM